MAIDMKTPIFNREQIDAMLNGFKLIGYGGGEFRRDWRIHV